MGKYFNFLLHVEEMKNNLIAVYFLTKKVREAMQLNGVKKFINFR